MIANNFKRYTVWAYPFFSFLTDKILNQNIIKGLVYGMSGILIPSLSDAALPEFMALCIRQHDVRGPSQEGCQFRDP